MYYVQVYFPTNAFIPVALACFGVIIVIRVLRWVVSIAMG
jgi:hypothetical protein